MTAVTRFRPRRSCLYVPGANARALEKAKSLPADVVILDLEDAVAPDAKGDAREAILAAVGDRSYGAREVLIRVNGLETEWGRDDLEMAVSAGVDGVLTVDIPPEEGQGFVPAMKAKGIDPIFLVAPTSHKARIERITGAASGFVYYVSLKGVTGAANLSLDAVRAKLAEIRECTDLPVGVGFGIKDAETAAAMSEFADAVVVGSALVSRIEAHLDEPDRAIEEIKVLLGTMRAAMDAA